MPTDRADRLEGPGLERAVDALLRVLAVDHVWLNRNGESFKPYDFMVNGRHRLDAKGSVQYPNSFVTVKQLRSRVGVPNTLWYVTSDFDVVSADEITEDLNGPQRFSAPKDYYDRKVDTWYHGVVFRGIRPLGEWVASLR